MIYKIQGHDPIYLYQEHPKTLAEGQDILVNSCQSNILTRP